MKTKVVFAALVPIALLFSLVAWAFSSPVGSSPDDDYHMASIWCGQGIREGLCEAGSSDTTRVVPVRLVDKAACYMLHPEHSANCPEEPSTSLTETKRGNFTGDYPPVYYAVMSVFAGPNIDLSILVMRIVNALLFVGVMTLLFFLLPVSRRAPLLWGALITIVPLGMFLIPSVNPSSWALTSAATLWAALLGFFEARTRPKRLGFAAIAVAMTLVGAGARADSAVYSAIAVIVVLVLTFERTRRYLLSAILPAALVVLAIALYFTAGQTSVTNPEGFSGIQGSRLALIMANIEALPQLWAGALGTWGLGWLDTPMPGTVWVFTIFAFSALVFWGFQRLDLRKGIALSVAMGSLILIPLYILLHDRIIVGTGVQPRYIYPLMFILAGVALVGFTRHNFGLSRWQLGLVAALLIVANTVALQVNIRRYVTGLGPNGLNLDQDAQWWWAIAVGPTAMWIIGSVLFAAAVVGATVLSEPGRSELPEPALPRG